MLFEKNIKKYYIFQFLTGLNFSEAVFYLFLLANGLNYTQTIFTQTWFTLIILLCQVPAGTLADLWSRKNVLLTGMILMLTGSIIYATSSSFLYFLIAETFWGVGVAFSFGTMSAFVYESIIHSKQENKSKEIFSNGSFYLLMGGVIAPPIGSLVASYYGLRSAIYLMIPPMIVSLLFMIGFKEPPKTKKVKKSYIDQIKESVKYVRGHELLTLLIFSNVTIALLFWVSSALYQPHLQNTGIDIKWFGFIFGGINLASAFVCKQAHSIEKKLGMYRAVVISSLIPSIGFLLLGVFFHPLLAVLGIVISRVSTRFRQPLFMDYYNRLVGSDKRATVISFSDFIYWVSFTLVSPVVGYFSDLYGIPPMFIAFSVVGFFVTMIMIRNPERLNGANLG